MQRRIRARRKIQFAERAGNVEGDLDAAGLGLQIDIEHRLDVDRIKERNRSLRNAVPRAEEDHPAVRDVDAAQHGGTGVGATDVEVGLHLDILREGALHLDIRRGGDLDIESKAAEQARTGRRSAHRPGGLHQQRAEIRLRIEAGAQHRDGAGENAGGSGPSETQVRVGHRADALRIAHTHLMRGGVQAKYGGPVGTVSRETAELDLAAAGLAGETLDGGAVAAE